MAFINGQLFLEFAIRVGTDDIVKDPSLLDSFRIASPNTNQGAIMSPAGVDTIREKQINDFFYDRLNRIPKRESETGMSSVFRNEFTKLADVKEYVRTMNIALKHQFPRDSQDLPCISIILGNETEEAYLGLELGIGVDPTTNEEYRFMGVNQDVSYNISILTTNENELQILSDIVKYCLLRYRRELEGLGLKHAKVSIGDAEPASEYLQSGHFVFQRSISFQCSKLDYFPVKTEGFTSFEFGNPNEVVLNETI